MADFNFITVTELRHCLESAKGNVLPFNDLLIAAAAIEQGYAVLTENVRHFQKIPGLNVIRI